MKRIILFLLITTFSYGAKVNLFDTKFHFDKSGSGYSSSVPWDSVWDLGESYNTWESYLSFRSGLPSYKFNSIPDPYDGGDFNNYITLSDNFDSVSWLPSYSSNYIKLSRYSDFVWLGDADDRVYVDGRSGVDWGGEDLVVGNGGDDVAVFNGEYEDYSYEKGNYLIFNSYYNGYVSNAVRVRNKSRLGYVDLVGFESFEWDDEELILSYDDLNNHTSDDSDGDGVINYVDAFPYDATETTDTDSDGVGDNSDIDIDGDGVTNLVDVFPYDATETTDTDSDGVGDNSDTDIDGDGVHNSIDAFPSIPSGPAIIYQPQRFTNLAAGSSHTLSVYASVDLNGESLSYQWQSSLATGWQDIEGATNSEYTAIYNTISDSGLFRVVVSNSTSSVTSDTASLIVDDPSKSYTFVSTAMTWPNAKAYAESQGGSLLEINSYGEALFVVYFIYDTNQFSNISIPNDFLIRTIAEDGGGSAYLWLGGSDSEVEGEWRWASNGEQFWSGSKNGTAVNDAFNRWGTTTQQNEPDNYGGSQDALALALETWPYATEGTDTKLGDAFDWNDINANNELYFIIEKDLVASESVEEDPSWVPEGWVYYAWPYAYSFSEGRWHFFNELDTQYRVNLSSGVWGTLDAASGWNYYAWPYSYSFAEGAWHWYNNDTQWVVDLISGEWSTFGSSGN